jgi:hypothetical protein
MCVMILIPTTSIITPKVTVSIFIQPPRCQ